MSTASQVLSQCVCQLDAGPIANHYHINILRWTFQDDVAYIAAYYITLQPQGISGFANAVQDPLTLWRIEGGCCLPCSLTEVVVFLYGVYDSHLGYLLFPLQGG